MDAWGCVRVRDAPWMRDRGRLRAVRDGALHDALEETREARAWRPGLYKCLYLFAQGS